MAVSGGSTVFLIIFFNSFKGKLQNVSNIAKRANELSLG